MKHGQKVRIRNCPIFSGWKGRVRANNYKGTDLILVQLDEPARVKYPHQRDDMFTFFRSDLKVI